MKLENTKAQMRKGVLELCVLSIISEGEAYPRAIIEHLKESELIVVEGTLYPLITRLKNAGLLSYRLVESSKGPARKYYSLTAEGEEFMQGLHETWMKLVNAVNKTTQNVITNE